MDIIPLAGMLFSLLTIIIIAGSVLMFPVMRRLATFLEVRIEERRNGALGPEDAKALQTMVEGLRGEVARLSERQAFTERLLEAPRSGGTGTASPGTEGP